MRYLKAYKVFEKSDTFSMFQHTWDPITDDDNFYTEFFLESPHGWDNTYKVTIHCNKYNITKDATKDGFNIKELSDRLLLPFTYAEELGIRIDFITIRDIDGNWYEVDECIGYSPTLGQVIDGKISIKDFLEEWCRDYRLDNTIMDLSFNFLTLKK